MSTATYYFDSFDVGEAWETDPEKMVDNNISNYASTETDAKVELLDGNTCDGTNLGSISKVEIRVYGINDHPTSKVIVRPVFTGGDGNNHQSTVHSSNAWSNWIDITGDNNAPDWDWTHVQNLDCDIEYQKFTTGSNVSKVEIRVTYTVSVTFPESSLVMQGYYY